MSRFPLGLSYVFIIILICPSILMPPYSPLLLEDYPYSTPKDAEFCTEPLASAHLSTSKRALPIQGGSWVQFHSEAEIGGEPEITLLSSDTIRLVVLLECPGMWRDDIILNHTVYDRLEIISAESTADVGNPNIPVLTKMLEVPYDIDVSVELLDSEYQDLSDYHIAPRQELVYPTPSITYPRFFINTTVYNQNSFYPTSLTWIEGSLAANPIVIRGHRIITLHLAPLQFNPDRHICRVFSKIKVAVRFARPAAIEPISSRLQSSAFEGILENYLLNYPHGFYSGLSTLQNTTPWIPPIWTILPPSKQMPTSGCEYLIISHDDFVEKVRPLANWKIQKGITTKLISVTGVFNELNWVVTSDPDTIRSAVSEYIQWAYNSWDLVPTYALLVGDEAHIPPHYMTIHPQYLILSPTDLGYFQLDGPDYLPEMLHGRLSVDSDTQAETFVNKILQYEQNGVTDPTGNFYNRICASAYFQDRDNNGQEDPAFRLTQTAEKFREYVTSRSNPYDVDYFYVAGAYNLDPFAITPSTYEDGTPLDSSLAGHDWFHHFTQAQNVIDTINLGSFLLFNLGHGESRNFYRQSNGTFGPFDGWQYPPFVTDQFHLLTNGDKLPVVLSLDCNTGWFDEAYDYSPANYESFSEEITRKAGGGAVAALGASRPVQAPVSALMLEGIADAIWADYDGNIATGGLNNLGQIIHYSKMLVMEQWGYLGEELCSVNTFELYHLFGDPEMPLWTQEPEDLEVYYPTHIGMEGEQRFVVQVTRSGFPIGSARVCLQKGGELYAVNFTDSRGYAYFSVNPITSGSMNLTVTAKNHLPYTTVIFVTSGGGVQLSRASGAEETTITITGTKFTSANMVHLFIGNPWEEEGSGQVPVDGRVEFTYTIPSEQTEPLNFWLREIQVISIDPPIIFTVRAGVSYYSPYFEAPDLYTYCQWNEETWHLNPKGSSANENPCWDNPSIEVKDDQGNVVTSGNLQIGSIYTIHADIHNAGPIHANNVKVFFNWSRWGIGQVTWHAIGNDTIDVLPWGQSMAVMVFVPTVEDMICIRVAVSHPEDSNPYNDWGVENTLALFTPDRIGIELPVFNPTSRESHMFIQLTQDNILGALWTASVDHISDSQLGPSESTNIIISFVIPDDVREGDMHNFTINAFIEQYITGGVSICLTKRPPQLVIPWHLILPLIVLVIISIIIVFVFKKRFRESDEN